MKVKKIAVIIPLYINDKLEYLKKAVQSILDQSYKDYFLFIAVDGPLNMEVDEYLKEVVAENVGVLRYQDNRGLASVLNDSIRYVKEAGFKFVARMDADDISHKDRISMQMAFLDKNSDVQVLGTQAFIIDSNDTIIGIKNAQHIINYNVLKKRSDIIHPSAIFAARFFDTVGYYSIEVSRAEDYDLWFRAAKKKVIIKSLPERLYYFRYDENIVERRRKAQKHIIAIKKGYLAFYEYLNLIPHYIIRFMPKPILKYILYKVIKFKK